jgi:Rap1a immunity proteins
MLAAYLSVLPVTSHAQETPHSANYVMQGCRHLTNPQSSNEIFVQGKCMGVISAIVSLDEAVCSPRGATQGQSVRVVIAYIDARPARLHEEFYKLALEALRDAWPCKR